MIEKKTFLKKCSVKLLILLLLIDLIAGGVFVYLFLANIVASNLVIISASIVTLFFMSMLLNELTMRLIDKRFNKSNAKPKFFYLESLKKLDETIKSANIEIKTFKYGISYLYIRNKVAFKVLVIDDVEKYFEFQDTQNPVNKNSKLESCEKFIAFEIFDSMDEEIIKKVQLYNFQTEKVYYGGFYYDKEHKLAVQANFETPTATHHENYEFLLNLIGMVPNGN